jgi:hypothetical protein
MPEGEILCGIMQPPSIVGENGELTSLGRWLRDQLPARYRQLAAMTKKYGGSYITFPLLLLRVAPDLFEKHAGEFAFSGRPSELKRVRLLTAMVEIDAKRFGKRAVELAQSLTDPDMQLEAAQGLVARFPDEACRLALAATPKLRHGSDRATAIQLMLEAQKAAALPHLALFRDDNLSCAVELMQTAERVAGAAAVPAIVDRLIAPHPRNAKYGRVDFPIFVDALCELLDRHGVGAEWARLTTAFADEKTKRIRERIKRVVSGASTLPPEPTPAAATASYGFDTYAEAVAEAGIAAVRSAARLPSRIAHVKLVTVPDGVAVEALLVAGEGGDSRLPLSTPLGEIGDARLLAELLRRHARPKNELAWGDVTAVPSSLVVAELIGAVKRIADFMRAANQPLLANCRLDVGDRDSSFFDANRLVTSSLEELDKALTRPVFVEEFTQLCYAGDARRRWLKSQL